MKAPSLRVRPVVTASIALLLAACRTISAPGTDVKVLNGTPPGPGHPALTATVALTINESVPGHCSGTLVAPSLVVTAAHCVGEEVGTSFVYFQNPDGSDGGEFIAIAESKAHPRYDRDKAGPLFDIGWIKLAEPAPEGYVPARILPESIPLAPGMDAIVAGFGRTRVPGGFEDTRSRVKLAADVKVKETGYSATRHGIFVTYAEGRGACSGDSGGSLFVRAAGTWYLAGAVRGPADILSNDTCSRDGESHTSVQYFAPWIAASSGVDLPGVQADPSDRLGTGGASHASLKDWCNDPNLSYDELVALWQFLYELATTCEASESPLFRLEEQLRRGHRLTMPANWQRFASTKEVHQLLERLPNDLRTPSIEGALTAFLSRETGRLVEKMPSLGTIYLRVGTETPISHQAILPPMNVSEIWISTGDFNRRPTLDARLLRAQTAVTILEISDLKIVNAGALANLTQLKELKLRRTNLTTCPVPEREGFVCSILN